MFKTRKSDLQHGLERAREAARDNLAHLSGEAKTARRHFGKRWHKGSRQTRGEVSSLLDGIRSRLSARSRQLDTDKLKDHLKLQLSDWKDSVRHETEQALKTGRVKSKRMLRKRSLLSLTVAVGVGAALGYLAAHQRDEAE